MLRFLFWNLNRTDLHGFVSRLAHQEKVDVLILAECPTDPALLLQTLTADSPNPCPLPNRLKVRGADALVTADNRHIEINGSGRHHTIWHIRDFGA